MKIVDIKAIHVNLPLRTNYKSWTGEHKTQPSIVTIIDTDEGISGISSIEPDRPNYSEQSWHEILSTINIDIKEILIGMDPLDLSRINSLMEKLLYGRYMSKAAIDIALNDLKAKYLGVPLYKLIGGAAIEKIDIIGWIGLEGVEETIKDSLYFIENGFKTLKIKIGKNVEDEVKRIKNLRDAIGYNVKLRLDANQALTPKSALKLAKEIYRYEIELLEQPVSRDDIEGMRYVNIYSDIPVLADESVITPRDLILIAEKRAASIVKLKAMRSGGVSKTKFMFELCEMLNIECIIGHGFSTTLGALAEAHIAFTIPSIQRACEFVGPLKLIKDISKKSIVQILQKGYITVNEISKLGNGLGVNKDELIFDDDTLFLK
ncbi:Mandelate racemase/muconate lactonizing protein [Sulfolobus islandicus Y.N.15.51]|jgi:L-alanine-DL-glutamate epimerase-like enolase superfamily enzyme|uniref:Mandelate racemase/muconate lactonizing protein n=1 Tax=Saccharolobus islandicus (strain Y.N.15.51 / Yellowstone \|nr:enolase C-terminal domain-like protein [Sulfolobus islandicus]ACP49107.1 Mandelate racemase/muconate lactonizing protein [Sulfolobus islandicus Y.N.15.51]